MPTTSSIASSIRKPFTANKRLFTLLTVALIIIGLLAAGYYSHVKKNEQNFRESKLQSLDSHFGIISRQLDNDVQSYNSQKNIVPDKVSKDSLIKHADTLKKRIASIWKKPTKSLKLDQDFDEYIVVITDPINSMDDIYKSSLKGSIKPPDSLFQSNLMGIGVSLAIPEKETKYQLFGQEYNYETSLNQHTKLKIKVIGLIKADRYNESIRKIDPLIIALLTTFLLLSLFGLPYFKMLFIAQDERLSSNDVILSGISVVVGAPIIMIVFLSLMNHYYDYYYTVPGHLKELSKDIGHRFEKENRASVDQLYAMSLKKEDSIHMDVGKEFFKISKTELKLTDNFKFVSKTDTTGKVLYHLALINNVEIKNTINLGGRPYFMDFHNAANVWLSENEIEYVMRPVVSIEDQTEEAVYILNNKSDPLSGYRIGSSQLKSVHKPILPFGYQFAIVDNGGEVWFHSEGGRATLENFFTVSREFNDLKAAVLGRIDAHGLVNYRDQNKLFNVTPIEGTDLSVIALYDMGLLGTRVSEVLTLASMAIVLAFLLMFLITILSLIIRNPKLGLYKYDTFLFEFLTPKKEQRDTYILLSSLFLGILLIAMIIGGLYHISPPKVYIICLLLAMWSYLIVYYTLHPYRNKRDIKFRVRDLLLLLVIGILNVIMIKLNTETDIFLVASIVLQLCCLLFIILGQVFSLPKKIMNICKYNILNINISYRYWYSIFLFSWLLLAAVFPAFLVFEKAKYLNDKIWLKTDKVYMAQKYMAKESELDKSLPAFKGFEPEYKELYKNHLREGLYPDSIKIEGKKDTIRSSTMAKETILSEFLWSTRPIYDERVSEYQALVYLHAQDASWSSDKESNMLTLKYLDKKGGVQVTDYRSKNFMDAGLGFPPLKLTGIVLILAILFSLVLFFVDRFFAFRFRHLRPNDFDTNDEKDYIKKFGHMLLAEKSNSGLLLIGLPFSGKREFALKIIESSGYTEVATLSMLRLENVDTDADISDILTVLAGFTIKDRGEFNWEEHEVFILEHLEHNIKSFQANHTKLKVISFLISKKKRVVLISEVYPSQIFAFYETPPEKSNLPWGSLEDDFNSWRNILSAFPQVLIGITKNTEKVYHVLGIRATNKPTRFEQTIAPLVEELGHSKFLPTLAPIILSKTLYSTENPNDKDQWLDRQRMVMHTQNLGHGYYNDIWNALPTRERYMLYDLAKDGFLNIKNRNSLFSLMKKGLVVWRDRPAIFNYSFKNFIITSVSLNEALRLENKNRGKGSWGNIRIVFYLIILTTILFIAMGKPELLQDFEALIGTLGGLGVVIPLVSKLLSSGGRK